MVDQAQGRVYLVREENLKSYVAKVLQSVGSSPEDSLFVAEVLVEADLRGVESHGVTRLPGYISMIENDLLNLSPNIKILKDSGATASIDGDMGFGMLTAFKGMSIAIDKARDFGVGAVTASNMAHTGMVGFFTMHAAQKGFIGMAMNNGPTIVPPFGGLTPTYATNPFSVAFPSTDGKPIVLDMATSMVAAGKLRLAAKKGETIPSDWGIDKDGNETTDPEQVIHGGFLQWAGGYKGFGLATMVEILGGVLSGGLFGLKMPALVNFGQDPLIANGFYLAIDIERFMPLEIFGQKVSSLVQDVKSSKKIKEVEQIYMPGEPEFENKAKRLESGIPLNENVFNDLKDLSHKFELSFDL